MLHANFDTRLQVRSMRRLLVLQMEWKLAFSTKAFTPMLTTGGPWVQKRTRKPSLHPFSLGLVASNRNRRAHPC